MGNDRLDKPIPTSPTADSPFERIKAVDELTESGGSGDLAAVLTDTDAIQKVTAKSGGTEIAASKSIIDVIGTDGNAILSRDYDVNRLMQYLHGFHSEVLILFVIPEAVGSINAHNTAILTELQKCGDVVTITQADALSYPDFEGISICVLGTDNGTAWTVANLADIKTIPDLPLLSCDATTAAYFEIGTDGGDAAAKTDINAVANINGSVLGAGLHGITGLAAGANTVSSSTVYNTLDMSDANITETWYAYESVNANTDVVLGEVRRVQPDGSIGINETGAEVPATMSFFGCAYSANDLNTLGKDVLKLLVLRLIEGVTIGSTLTISGDVGNLETKLLGNMTTKHSNSSPLAAFVSGNSGSLGSELANNESLADVLYATNGIVSFPAAAAPGNGVSIAEVLRSVYDDTNELQGDWVNGGRLDLILDELTTQGDTNETKIDTVDTVVDAIKAITDLLAGFADNKTQFTDPGDAGVATVTGAAGANTFGTYTQAIASTGQDQWLVGISTELDQVDNYTIEVATGAAASESPICEFKYEAQNADTSVTLSCLPIKVASGTRVALRLKTVGGGSDTISNTDLIWRKA
jgi:hypothetical protein